MVHGHGVDQRAGIVQAMSFRLAVAILDRDVYVGQIPFLRDIVGPHIVIRLLKSAVLRRKKAKIITSNRRGLFRENSG